jgi:D-glycero-beta-D-manno-heptose 1-phosphate adenylyltransferase
MLNTITGHSMKLWQDKHLEKVIPPEHLTQTCEEIRSQKKTIATLNGSFDLLHAGHLQMIFEASQVADVLIVALNSDASIQKYKSTTRPIIPLQSRIQMVTALQFVDYVTWFDETNPLSLLEMIQPDVHVNGSEYGENCIEAETVKRYGGTLHIVQLIPGLSTSNIIDKIKNS